SQIWDRLSLGVQQPLYSLDDFIAVGKEQLKKFDVRVKRQFAHHNTHPWTRSQILADTSKRDFGCDLNLSRIAGAQYPPEIGVAQRDCRRIEIGVIEEIESLAAQLQVGALTHGKLLEHGKI